MTKGTNASAVARALKRAGVPTVPDRSRNGLYVTGGDNHVALSVQHDFTEGTPGWARRLRDTAIEVLVEAGYTVTPNGDSGELFTVTRGTA